MMYVPSLPVLLVVLNVISLMFFGVDKLKSMRRGWRISELRLLSVALIGPFGAYAGMLLFRHKIRKVKFILVPIFLFVHLYLIIHFEIIHFDLI